MAGIFIFFSPSIIGAAILWRAVRSATTQRQVLTAGLIGGGLMALNSFIFFAFAGIGSATSGSQKGYNFAGWVTLIFVGCIVTYFVVAPLKAKKRHADGDTKSHTDKQ